MRIVAALCVSLVGTVSTTPEGGGRTIHHGTLEQLHYALSTRDRVWVYKSTNRNESRECEYMQVVAKNETEYVLDWFYKVPTGPVQTRLNATVSWENGTAKSAEGPKITAYSKKGSATDYLLVVWDNDLNCGVFSYGPAGTEKTTADVCEMCIYDHTVKSGNISKCEEYFSKYCNHFPNHENPNIVYQPECQFEEGC